MIAGQITAIMLQTAFFLILVRILDTYQYGLFIGASAFVAILAQFATLGQGTVLIRQLSQTSETFLNAWGPTLRTAFLGCIVTALVALLVGWRLLHQAALFRLLPIIVLSDLVCNKTVELASQAFQANARFRAASQISILPNLAKFVAVSCAAVQISLQKSRLSALGWGLWYAAASVCVCGVALLAVRHSLGRAKDSYFKKGSLWEGLSYAVSGASFYIYNDIDKTFLVADGFVAEAGFYGAAYRLIEVMTAPLRALNTAALPRFFTARANGIQGVRAVMLRVLAPSVLYSFVCGWVILIFHGTATTLLGKEYGAAGQVLRYLCFIPLIRCVHYGAGNALTALGAQWSRTTVQLGAAVFNISLNVYLIPKYSWHGAAWSSVATETCLAVSMVTALAVSSKHKHKESLQQTQGEQLL